MAVRDIVTFGNRRGEGLARRGGYADPFSRMHKEMDRMFQDFFGGFPRIRDEEGAEWGLTPDIDVTESDKEIRVKAELPGVTEDDIDVRLENNTLVISGEKKEETEDKDGSVYRSECCYGSFMRSVPLSAEVDADKVDASFKNGILRVKLPKTGEEKATGKRIQVKHG